MKALLEIKPVSFDEAFWSRLRTLEFLRAAQNSFDTCSAYILTRRVDFSAFSNEISKTYSIRNNVHRQYLSLGR